MSQMMRILPQSTMNSIKIVDKELRLPIVLQSKSDDIKPI